VAAAGAGVIGVEARTGAADRGAVGVESDQRPGGLAAAAFGWVVEDVQVAGVADRSDGPAGLDDPGAVAAAAGVAGLGCAGAAAQRAVRSASAWSCPPAVRADRLWAVVAAVAEIRIVCGGSFLDGTGAPAAPACPALLVARIALLTDGAFSGGQPGAFDLAAADAGVGGR
jgi:hypothetical protein